MLELVCLLANNGNMITVEVAPDASVNALLNEIAQVKQFSFPVSDLTLSMRPRMLKTCGYQLPMKTCSR